MNTRSATAILLLCICLSAGAASYTAPRTSDGQPDLQGFWTNATLTPARLISTH